MTSTEGSDLFILLHYLNWSDFIQYLVKVIVQDWTLGGLENC